VSEKAAAIRHAAPSQFFTSRGKEVAMAKKYLKNTMLSFCVSLLFFSCAPTIVQSPAAGPQAQIRQDSGAGEIESRSVDIWSDGTRLSGDLWYPKGLKAGDHLPAIILCHGWGGTRSHLNKAYAPVFARAGYVVLTFDYRGWADSDSRLVVRDAMPAPDENGMVTVRAQAIRELVDPFDQTEDIISCIDFICGEPGVDHERIGLWGTSFGGGHVVYVAARDRRIKCIVSQVPSMDGSWATVWPDGNAYRRSIQRARGEIDPVPQGVNQIGQLRGTAYLSRIAKFRPVEFADQLKIPILIIVAEHEELMNNKDHGEKVYHIVKNNVAAKYEVFAGTHFEIYGQGRMQAIQMAIEWYDKHL
jgi:dienelactone hydrolase